MSKSAQKYEDDKYHKYNKNSSIGKNEDIS